MGEDCGERCEVVSIGGEVEVSAGFGGYEIPGASVSASVRNS